MTKDEAGQLIPVRYPINGDDWNGDVVCSDVLRGLESKGSTWTIHDVNDEDCPESYSVDLDQLEYRDGDNWIPLARIESEKSIHIVSIE